MLGLHAEGWNASHIARETSISRSTVRDWIAGKLPHGARHDLDGCARGAACLRSAPTFHTSYAYMLGMYLGDGCISSHHRDVYKLRVSLDSRYPELVFECRMRMPILCPDNSVGVIPMSGEAKGVVVQAYSKHWPCLFPQHGPGTKHTRIIDLEDWQQSIVDAEPELLLRGLIHSDGCRIQNNRGRGSRWTGTRYMFWNLSPEIRTMFTDACAKLGIHWTAPSSCTISVARRADTARLDQVIGPKH